MSDVLLQPPWNLHGFLQEERIQIHLIFSSARFQSHWVRRLSFFGSRPFPSWGVNIGRLSSAPPDTFGISTRLLHFSVVCDAPKVTTAFYNI